MKRRMIWLGWMIALMVTCHAAWADTGVSDSRVSLPEGPGSLEGVGENISVNNAMGTMSYSVPFNLPQGYPGMTPSLGLSYSSGGGGSVVGIGWSFDTPYIERSTVRGLPEYDTDDEFSVNGQTQLVRIPGTNPAVYRARFEGGFVRYHWMDAGDGTQGWWKAEYPNGQVAYFGADAEGTLNEDARVGGAGGTFRYYLTERHDPFGHQLTYSYSLFGNVTLVQRIAWAFAGEGGQALYSVTFNYETRQDKLSDCKAGFNELLEHRLSQVNVFAHQNRIRYYTLNYEDYDESGGFSRLSSVTLYGREGSEYPAAQSFEYSKALGVLCGEGEDCLNPYVESMGSIGVDLQSGDATLIDINGDALPDLVDSSQAGEPHRFFINTRNPDGSFSFDGPYQSSVGNQGGFDLSSAYVQVMDVEGDGFVDMINSQTGQVLSNLGGGDWDSVYSLWDSGDGGTPDLAGDFDASDGELRTVRFMDYDNDKKIDLIRSQGADASNVTTIYRNVGSGGFQSDDNAASIGAGFESDSLELNDMNGDGLTDPVQVMQSELRYRLNLGWGQWSDWEVISGFDFTAQEAKDAELEDLNGDALADLVLVSGNEVHYWINRNGASFDAMETITSADIDGEIPERTSAVTVLYADMNGNGSSDVVWIDASGNVTCLEIFPVRPNLLSRITNGLGMVQEIQYESAVTYRADDDGSESWSYPLPHPMLMVSQTASWDEINQVDETRRFRYHQGYYDGEEKQFRGFESVEIMEPGDETSEEALILEQYDLGVEDSYRNGLMLSREIRGAEGRSIEYLEKEYRDCPLTGIPENGLLFPIRFLCQTSEITTAREGLSEADWVQSEERVQYDGYGNVTLKSDLGIVSIGGGGCVACEGTDFGEPCGVECLGDEAYERTEYALPEENNDLWMLGLPVRKQTYGTATAQGDAANSVFTETLTYYDGDAFIGLDLGQVQQGKVSRVTERVNAEGDRLTQERHRYDVHGNVIESLDALGAEGQHDHRRSWVYDAAGLKILESNIHLSDDVGNYSLRRDVVYDPVWDEPIEATAWMLVRGASPETPRNSTYYTYDEFKRLRSITLPGEEAGFATEEFSYQVGSPASRVTIRSRSEKGGTLDIERHQCYDGYGRVYQERQKVRDGQYLVKGYTVFNTKGEKQEIFQDHMAQSEACDLTPPGHVLSMKTSYDAAGRETLQRWPEVSTGEQPSTRREYLPRETRVYDLEDTNQNGNYANTPEVERVNGLGQVVAKTRSLSATSQGLTTRFAYDELGNLTAVVDPEGNERRQVSDFMGRVISVDDPDRGATSLTYDDEGNLLSRTDARGVTLRRAYDGDNRLTEIWEEGNREATLVTNLYDTPGSCPLDQCTNVAGYLAKTTYPLDNGQQGEDRHGFDLRGKGIFFGRVLDGHLFEIQSEYDNLGRPSKNTYPDGREITFDLDGASRLIAVPGVINDMDYDDRGLLTHYEFANGVTVARGHDERERLISLDAIGPDSSQILSYTYERDRIGHVTRVLDGRSGSTPSGNARYTYDALYRLTNASLDDDQAAFAETLDIAYDGLDRITSKTSSLGAASPAHVGSYTYGDQAGPYAVTQAGSVSLAYDAAGNLTDRGGSTYEWDHYGRLIHSENEDGDEGVYLYDSGVQRVIKRDGDRTSYTISSEFEVRDGVAVTYVIVDDTRMARLENPAFATELYQDIAPASGETDALTPDPDDEITAADAWLAHASANGLVGFAGQQTVDAPAVLLEASLNRLLKGEEERARYLHHDHLGGVVAVTDENGAVVERSEYYPYGELRYQLGATQDYGFTGKEKDHSSGLIYFGARYYDPQLGRWTAADPAFAQLDDNSLEHTVEGSDVYGFNRGNPTNRIDRDGQLGLIAIGAIVGGITAGVMEASAQIAKGQWKNTTWKKKMKLTAKIVGKGLLGAALGALTGGLGAKLLGAGAAAKAIVTAGVVLDGIGNVASRVAEIVTFRKFRKQKDMNDKIAGNFADSTGDGVSTAISGTWGIVQLGMGSMGGLVSLGKAIGWSGVKGYKRLKKGIKRRQALIAKKNKARFEKKMKARNKRLKQKKALSRKMKTKTLNKASSK